VPQNLDFQPRIMVNVGLTF